MICAVCEAWCARTQKQLDDRLKNLSKGGEVHPCPRCGGVEWATTLRSERAIAAASEFVDIVFDGPPSHESGRFVEVENDKRQSIRFGEWVERDDGYWVLRIPAALAAAQRVAGLELPEGKYVMFMESGDGRPCRLILQFQELSDMQRAHGSLLAALALSPGKVWKRGDHVQFGSETGTLNAPTNEKNPTGLWWVEIPGEVGLRAVDEDTFTPISPGKVSEEL